MPGTTEETANPVVATPAEAAAETAPVADVTESTTTEVEAEETTEFETFAAEDFNEIFDEAPAEAEAEAETTEESGEGAKDAPTPEEAAAAVAAQAEADAAAATPAEQVAEVEAAPETVLTPEQQAEQLAQFDAQATTLLAEQVYALSEDQIAEFEEDPGKALPKLAANLHLQVMRAATQNVARLLPQMIQHITQSQTQTRDLSTQFFDANKQLVGHEETVHRIGQVYRQLNPNATPETFIKEVGAQATVALGLQQTPAAAPAPVVQQAPHVPVGAGATAAQTKPVETNEFAILAQEDVD